MFGKRPFIQKAYMLQDPARDTSEERLVKAVSSMLVSEEEVTAVRALNTDKDADELTRKYLNGLALLYGIDGTKIDRERGIDSIG